MNFVEKHSKLLAVALCLCASGPILSTVHAYEVQPGWHTDGKTSYYVLDNHKKAKGLTEIDDEKYYFDQSGKTVSGWQNVDNQIYYFDNNGKAVTGKTEIQGTAYNFGTSGTLSQGWEDDNYYNEKGFKVTSDLVSDDEGKYYVDNTGCMVTGAWQQVSGDWYYFDDKGQAVTGQVDTDNGTYYTDEDGILRTGWRWDGHGKRYYLWDGSVNLQPFRNIDGVYYAFDENGYLLTNTEKDGYIIDGNGVATLKPEGEGAPVEDAPVVDETETPADTTTPPAEDGTITAPEQGGSSADAPAADETVNAPVEEPEYQAPAENVTVPGDSATVGGENEDAPVVEDVTPVEPEVSMPTVPEPTVDDYYYDEPIYPDYSEVIPEDITTPAEPEVEDDYLTEELPEEDIIYGDNGSTDVLEEPMEPVVDTSKASVIASAAMAQIGANQDCTMLVTNALAAAGISFHGWPADYAALGSWTSNPVPGDIIIYSGHVAVYIGNGQAVHGGFNGANTVVWSVNCPNALIGYIHVA